MTPSIIAPVTNIQELITVQRNRLLPADGQVLSEIGDRLEAKDVIAHSNFGNQHIMLDASTALGMSPKRAATFLQRQVGDSIEKGAILAGKRAFAARLLRSPVAGQIVAINGSQLLIQINEESSKLYARMPGKVVRIIPNRGVELKFIGSWIEGAWGNGAFNDGFLHFQSDDPAYTLNADDIDMNLKDSLVIAGHCARKQTLQLASQVPIAGLILGSIATRLIPIAEQMPFPIMLTEGFGEIPMNRLAFKLFNSGAKEKITINAQHENEFENQHPEAFIPIDNAGSPPRSVEAQSFRVGLSVRILSNPYIGEIGEISALMPSSTLYPSGIRAPGAEIVLKDGSATVIPLANLEVLG